MMKNENKRIAVIGGGPGGMAAAVAAAESGITEVVLIERHDYLGGVLPQCIHSGFGTQLYGKDYTGGEYAWLWIKKVQEAGIDQKLSTMVLSLERGGTGNAGDSGHPEDAKAWKISCVSSKEGAFVIEADAVIVATGCRERTLPQMLIPGSRPAGVFTAGSAQLMMNMKNYLPGRSAVIFGSGDIGLIMARRMTLEGINVKLILGQKATGLARNIVQCVEDFDIPMRYGWTLVSTHGYERLKGVTIAPFTEKGEKDLSKKEYIQCDTLLVATGLIPELEVLGGQKPLGEENMLFLCGNADFVHDLADHVTEEGIYVGTLAAQLLGQDVKLPAKGKPAGSEAMGKKGNMVCTVCPKSCIMQATRKPFGVTGNQCQKGRDFARQELENPKRVVTTIVGTDSSSQPVLAVRTDRAVDKSSIGKIMKAARKIRVSGKVQPGDLVAENVAGSGADLIATWSLAAD